MGIGSTITFGELTIGGGTAAVPANSVKSISPTKVSGTLKAKFNGRFVYQEIPNRTQEWRIVIRGKISGANRDTDRATLISYQDAVVRHYSDGIFDIDMVVEDLSFDGPLPDIWTRDNYTLTLREYTQSV